MVFFVLCQSVSTHIKKLFLGYLIALLSSKLKLWMVKKFKLKWN